MQIGSTPPALIMATHGLRTADVKADWQQPAVTAGAYTQKYFKNQVSQLSAQTAQLTQALQQDPGIDPNGPVGKRLSDLQAEIARYTKAMAKAPVANTDTISIKL